MSSMDAATWFLGASASFLAGLASFCAYYRWRSRVSRLRSGKNGALRPSLEERDRELAEARRDLVLAKAMAVQASKLSTLGQLAAGLAHEMKNPLNFLINIMPEVRQDMETLAKVREMALPAVGDPMVRDRISLLENETHLAEHLQEMEYVFGRIRRALENGMRLAMGINEFSRPADTGARAPENLAGMLASVLDLIPKSIKRDICIEMDLPRDLCWTSNRNEVEQAFLILINNAMEAMDYRGRLRIKAETEGGEARLSFQDQGPGIPAEVLPRIFEPFFTTKPPGKGTGLGLAIASEIVEKNGGRLSAESEPGKGAVFHIRFPVGPAPVCHSGF